MPGSAGEPLLFDLAADPEEERNLAADRPADYARLAALGEARDRRDQALLARLGAAAAASPELSAEDRARLRALGYLR